MFFLTWISHLIFFSIPPWSPIVNIPMNIDSLSMTIHGISCVLCGEEGNIN